MAGLVNLNKYENALTLMKVSKDIGKITQVTGQLLIGFLPGATLGSVCEVYPGAGHDRFLAEVVGFRDRHVLMMPLGEMRGVGLGSRVVLLKSKAMVSVGEELLGRVINGLGQPIDGKGELEIYDEVPLYSDHTNPLDREPISEQLELGVRAIDGLLSVGKGQRVGIMAGSGVGKSVLMGMMGKNTQADVNVIALVGERGREVREFIEHNLGEEGLKRSVIIVATSDQSPLLRMRAAFIASAVSEFFSGLGKDVLLMMDSVTRFAMAQREIGLSTGEPPASKGYTPSVFSTLPKLLERAGNFRNGGSVTGLYTVLVEGDDMDDPIGDAVRSIVDGHIVLERKLAHRNHYPAIDILQSTSRVMKYVIPPEQQNYANFIRQNLSTYQDAEDLINIGAYKSGANPQIDQAIQVIDHINLFLKQSEEDYTSLDETRMRMENFG